MDKNSKKVAVFLANGFEEMEALAPIDILRRAELGVTTVSINDNKEVISSRNVKVQADEIINNINFGEFDMIVLPGGPGYQNYFKSEVLLENIKVFSENKKVAAICAAPLVLASLGILNGKKAVCFPACEKELLEGGAILTIDKYVTDGNITTSRAAGTSIDFALELVRILVNIDKRDEIKNQIVY